MASPIIHGMCCWKRRLIDHAFFLWCMIFRGLPGPLADVAIDDVDWNPTATQWGHFVDFAERFFFAASLIAGKDGHALDLVKHQQVIALLFDGVGGKEKNRRPPAVRLLQRRHQVRPPHAGPPASSQPRDAAELGADGGHPRR